MKTVCVILNYHDAERVKDLALRLHGYSALDAIVVVDNASTDDSYEVFQGIADERIHVCRTDRNGGYGYGNNFGVRYAAERLGAELALIVNPDVAFEEALVERLKSEFSEQARLGVASAIQRDIHGNEVARSAWRIPRKWRYIFSTEFLLRHWGENFYYSLDELHREKTVDVDCVAGSLLMVSVEAFTACGGYDEEIFLYCEETVLGCKMKKMDYRTVICSDVSYDHLHGVSIQKVFSAAVQRKKLLLKSHRLVLKRYLHGNFFERLVDRLVGAVSVLELRLRALCGGKK
ncbi:MAG: glycosyltransferase family 2 protein [Ruminococcaceae bacterium]|nr:glycosyltransferase family 2 protein [Oscillospiraceae bacterium]